MTEAEWLAATDPTPMLEFLKRSASNRKLRLFACNCCRRFWHLMGEKAIPKEVERAEQFADDELDFSQLQRIRSRLGARGGYSSAWAASQAIHAVLGDSASTAATGAMKAAVDFRYLFASEGLQTTSEYQAAADRRAELEGLGLPDKTGSDEDHAGGQLAPSQIVPGVPV